MINIYSCFWGNKYPRQKVENLKTALEKHFTLPHKFYCVTDNPIMSYDLPIRYKFLKGMFIKMSLFEYVGPSLYFDLDIDIKDNIDFLGETFEGLTVVNSSNWKNKQSSFKFKINNNTLINTSIMRWSNQSYIFKKFLEKRDMYLRVYQATDRFIYNEGFEYNTFDNSVITSWLEKVEYGKILLYNGKYGQTNHILSK